LAKTALFIGFGGVLLVAVFLRYSLHPLLRKTTTITSA